MKLKRRAWMRCQFILLGLSLLMAPILAHTDDTYNFYFQKAPGPVTVNQGTKGITNESGETMKSVDPEKMKSDSATPTSISQTGDQEEELKHWSVSLLSGIQKWRGFRLGFDVNYHFNRNFAVGGGLLFPLYTGNYRTEVDTENLAWFGRFAITPLHIRLFDKDLIDAGLIVGVHRDVWRKALPVLGPTVDFNLSPSFALHAEVQFNAPKNYQALGGLRVRF